MTSLDETNLFEENLKFDESMESKNPETWDFFLDGNLLFKKKLVSFCCTGVDHALKQKNKSMKIQGGKKGVGNNESVLEEYFLISCEMSQVNDIRGQLSIDWGNEQEKLRNMLESWKK